MASLTSAQQEFWADFLKQHSKPAAARARFYESFRIGESVAAADEGARLILTGAKTASSSLLWEYQATGRPPAKKGSLSILLDGRDAPLAVVETTWLKLQPFEQVEAPFARDYGEWDGTLATWREKCWAFYAPQCAALGRAPSPSMPLVCERFRVVFPVG